MDEFFAGSIVGLGIGIIFLLIIAGGLAENGNNLANRSLSCMAAGNTVTQCQDVLGLKVNK